jgi:hypothetical protein
MSSDYFDTIPNIQEFITEPKKTLDELEGNIPNVVSEIIRKLIIQLNINIEKQHIYEATVQIPSEYIDLINYESDRETQICLSFYEQLRERLENCKFESFDIIDNTYIKIVCM